MNHQAELKSVCCGACSPLIEQIRNMAIDARLDEKGSDWRAAIDQAAELLGFAD